MPLLILSILLQVLLIVHVIRTGRNSLWIWALALLPWAGPIAYVLVEILPSLFQTRAARDAARAMRKTLDPDRDLRRYSNEVRLSGNVDSRRKLAEELVAKRDFEGAIETYRQALTGLYEHDPQLMLGLARAQFGKGEYATARATLDELIARNPDFKSADGHLLYARALEGEGNTARALDELRALSEYYPGAEAKVRYGMLLKKSGDQEAAHRVLSEVLESAQLAPAHYRRVQKEWLELAKREL
jgi:hypothetical protein